MAYLRSDPISEVPSPMPIGLSTSEPSVRISSSCSIMQTGCPRNSVRLCIMWSRASEGRRHANQMAGTMGICFVDSYCSTWSNILLVCMIIGRTSRLHLCIGERLHLRYRSASCAKSAESARAWRCAGAAARPGGAPGARCCGRSRCRSPRACAAGCCAGPAAHGSS